MRNYKELVDRLREGSYTLEELSILLPSAADAIEELLPSAQPEIVRCKDCKYRDAEDGFCEGRGWPMQLVPDDGFCNKGKRSEG